MITQRTPSILDVTIRDGGYVNGHRWTYQEARQVLAALERAGVPGAEVGYLRDGDDTLYPSAYCPSEYLEELSTLAGSCELVVMVRPGEVDPARLDRLPGEGVRGVRVLVPRGDLPAAEPYVVRARAAGLHVTCNLTHVSKAAPGELALSAEKLVHMGAGRVYLADSNGSLYPEGVAERVRALLGAVPETVDIGFHPHDNLSLAYANSLAAVEAGAAALDASLSGIGKGGGNLSLELIVAHFVARGAAGLSLGPLAQDATSLAGRLRMVAEGPVKPIVSGLLDLGLKDAALLEAASVRNDYDRLITDLSPVNVRNLERKQ